MKAGQLLKSDQHILHAVVQIGRGLSEFVGALFDIDGRVHGLARNRERAEPLRTSILVLFRFPLASFPLGAGIVALQKVDEHLALADHRVRAHAIEPELELSLALGDEFVFEVACDRFVGQRWHT